MQDKITKILDNLATATLQKSVLPHMTTTLRQNIMYARLVLGRLRKILRQEGAGPKLLENLYR